MPTLTIRNFDDTTHQALCERTAANGRSMEAEVRALIEEEVPGAPTDGNAFVDFIRDAIKGAETDLELPTRFGNREPLDFSGPGYGPEHSAAAEIYAPLRARLRKEGRNIQPLEIMIASIARVNDAAVATHKVNGIDFSDIALIKPIEGSDA